METKTPFSLEQLIEFRIIVEQFDTETEFRQRLYGRNGIKNSINLCFQGKKTDLPIGYEFLKFYPYKDYCIIYKK